MTNGRNNVIYYKWIYFLKNCILGGEFFRIKHQKGTSTFEDVIKEGMKAFGHPDDKI